MITPEQIEADEREWDRLFDLTPEWLFEHMAALVQAEYEAGLCEDLPPELGGPSALDNNKDNYRN